MFVHLFLLGFEDLVDPQNVCYPREGNEEQSAFLQKVLVLEELKHRLFVLSEEDKRGSSAPKEVESLLEEWIDFRRWDVHLGRKVRDEFECTEAPILKVVHSLYAKKSCHADDSNEKGFDFHPVL
jgi:hypothetical protein